MPETSIVIRTFNEEVYIVNLLSSIEKQVYRDYEVIIVVSGSTDRTLGIAEKFIVKIIEIDARDFTLVYALLVGRSARHGAC